MKKSTAIAVVLLGSIFAVAIPVWLAVGESQRQSMEIETERARAYARDVLHRSDSTSDQVASAIAQLRQIGGGTPCSPASISTMRQIDLSSSYIQAIGHVEGNVLLCSSLGRDLGQVALGPPDFVTARGYGVRKHLQFSFAPQRTFIALERDGYAAIIHKDLPIDVTTAEDHVSLAIYSLAETEPLSARGHIDPGWIKRLGSGHEAIFSDARYVVAVTRSTRYLTASVAAVPIAHLNARTREATRRLAPVAAIAGLALASALLLLARRQSALPAAIKAGLRRNEFYLLYQPVIDLRTGKLVGAEALLRWRRSTGELIGPDLFIPVAETSGVMLQLTQRVLELAAHDAGGFLQQHPDFHLAINVSAADLHSAALKPGLARLVQRTGGLPANFIIELTERGLMDTQVARDITSQIRTDGYAVAIDDFGTGYSSLSYLQSLAVDYLKIDKSFVEAIATDAPTSHVVLHIIALAKDMKLRMIAEGVETEAQAQFLRERGVEYAQGWLFGKPMRFSELQALRSGQK
ncbi:MAG TPA: EAL domain-containing protein [Burkholderiaceae bacterium]